MIPVTLAVAWQLTRWRLTGERARTRAYRQYRALGWSRAEALALAGRG